MTIDAFATELHYVEHLAPIWSALRPDERGTFGTIKRLMPLFTRLTGCQASPRRPRGDGPVLVAGFKDMRMVNRPAILVEHGAGQDYADGSPSNPGGGERHRVVLFLCPNESVALRNAQWYSAPAVVVGCPKMDAWHRRDKRAEKIGKDVTVAISFHYDSTQIQEARSAFPHYRRALRHLAQSFTTIGHGHPRAFAKYEPHYLQAGIEPVRHFDEVLERADIYVCDNSSTIPEFASTGRPVVFLNAPWYRADIDFGGRFWDWPRGQVQINDPDELVHGIAYALRDPWSARSARERMVRKVYAHTDGRAADRAVAAIRNHVLVPS